MTWERKLALCFFAVGLLFAVSTCFAAFSRSDRRVAYLTVLCPPDWRATISQRYDEWRKIHGQSRIIKSTWITKCQ